MSLLDNIEPVIGSNFRQVMIELIGASGVTLQLQAVQDGFTDNNELPEGVELRSQGELVGLVKGNTPASTGSFVAMLLSENNLKAEAYLDAVYGRNSWATESTGTVGSGPGNPYIPPPSDPAGFHVLDMRVTVKRDAFSGGPQVTLYKKVRFTWNYAYALSGNMVNLSWTCYAGRTVTGPKNP